MALNILFMDANKLVLDLILNNWILVLLFLFSIVKIIPPEWAGFWKYNNNKESDGLAPKITLLKLILHNFFDSVLSAFLIPLLAMFEFQKMVTFVIFVVVVFDVFIRHQISGGTVTLTSIGIIALYLERLIETGDEIKFLGGLFFWKKRN